MYELSRDKSRIDLDAVHAFLSTSYWAPRIRRAIVETAIRESAVVGAYDMTGSRAGGDQVGFARAITDYATFAYLCDVFVLDAHRARGLATRMVKELMADPRIQTVRRWTLATRDAMNVYTPLGFVQTPANRIWMERRLPPEAWQEPA
jgi:GNAT superfamily N-acetyltransferase